MQLPHGRRHWRCLADDWYVGMPADDCLAQPRSTGAGPRSGCLGTPETRVRPRGSHRFADQIGRSRYSPTPADPDIARMPHLELGVGGHRVLGVALARVVQVAALDALRLAGAHLRCAEYEGGTHNNMD